MPAASIQEYSDALSVPAGSRPLSSELDEINHAIIMPGFHYLHIGSGQFAVVFRCRTLSGGDVALRCLLLPPNRDAAERATAVGDFLYSLPKVPQSFVRYRFVSNAIYAANEWQDAYIMDWVDGKTLTHAVQDLVTNRDIQGLQTIADSTTHMIMEIQNAGIAHGDLHPENILVLPSGELRLVDYDSTYVPALQDRPCLVVGPEGYAHPAYVSKSLVRPNNIHMDTFAGLVLVTSLRALVNDLSLFQCFTKENLLFSAEDIRDPIRSPTFTTLLSQGDANLLALTNSLREMCLAPEKAQILLRQVQGIVQERRKAPGPRFTEPLLPKKPTVWKPQPAVAQSTFAAIFQSEA